MISEEEKLIATLATQLYSNRNHEDSPTWTHLRDRDVITLNDFAGISDHFADTSGLFEALV